MAVSGLEMAQNSARLSWSKEEVDEKLKSIMKSIFNASKEVRSADLTLVSCGLAAMCVAKQRGPESTAQRHLQCPNLASASLD